MPPNVLLIVLDTARADVVEPYSTAANTPALAQLADRGAALEGRATACWTVPSHASIFTGLLPRSAGLVKAPQGTPHSCRPVLEAQRDRLLPEVMRNAGYETGALSTNFWITEASGFATGFDRFETVGSQRQAQLQTDSLRSRVSWSVEALRARVDDGADAAAATLERWAAEPRERPFFWFVNLVECHSPYLPPRPYNDLSPVERFRAGEDARRYQTMAAIWQACAGALEVPAESLARMRYLYEASIRALDDWVARVLEALEGRGILEDTLVLVCSDHGENFGEQHLIGHAFSLDERLTRVPLIAAGPGAPDLAGPVSLAALPALIAAAVGVRDHPWEEPDGIALAQFEPPAPRGDERWEEARALWGSAPEAIDRLTEPRASATDGKLKLIRSGQREQLFDLAGDPLEENPLPSTPAGGRDDALRAALDRAESAAMQGDPAHVTPEPTQQELDELEERMKLLGYM